MNVQRTSEPIPAHFVDFRVLRQGFLARAPLFAVLLLKSVTMHVFARAGVTRTHSSNTLCSHFWLRRLLLFSTLLGFPAEVAAQRSGGVIRVNRGCPEEIGRLLDRRLAVVQFSVGLPTTMATTRPSTKRGAREGRRWAGARACTNAWLIPVGSERLGACGQSYNSVGREDLMRLVSPQITCTALQRARWKETNK